MTQDRVITSRCAVCRVLRQEANHWFLARATSKLFELIEWNEELAAVDGWRSACGEQHLQQLVSRWISHRSLDTPTAPLSQSVTKTFETKQGEETQ